jgi:hypothetical protein
MQHGEFISLQAEAFTYYFSARARTLAVVWT